MSNQFFERFPKYALLALQWQPKYVEFTDLIQWRSKLDLSNIEILYVVGIGNGQAYDLLKDWLCEDRARRLVFLEEDTGVVAALLERQTALFDDLQVDFECLLPETAIELAERYPAKQIEVVALPEKKIFPFSALSPATASQNDSFARLISRSIARLPAFRKFCSQSASPRTRFYANGLKGAFQGIPAIVCGAGPSLKKAIALLKKLEGRAVVIAGGSTLAALSSAGVEPHFGLAIDPNLEEYRRFRNSFAFECPLLISTRVFPGIFQTCNGPFGYLRSGIGGVPELWLEEELGLCDPLLGEHLSEESISVTAIALAFAQHIGCGPILLSGVDLAYTGGERYAPGISSEKTSLREMDAEKSAADRIFAQKR